MKNFTLSIVAVMAMSTFAIAQTYDAYGPNSYKALHDGDGSYSAESGANRKGFRLGLGIGAGTASVDAVDLRYGNISEIDEFGTALSFEIGYAFSNQFSINHIQVATGNGDGAAGLSGISMNYYFKDAIDTPYIVGGFGVSTASNSGTRYYGDIDTGTGVLLGVGYAMDKIEIEANIIIGEIDYSNNITSDMTSFQITVNYMFF